MRFQIQRVCCLAVLLLLLGCGSAGAEFAPRCRALRQQNAGWQTGISVKLERLAGLTPASLEKLRQELSQVDFLWEQTWTGDEERWRVSAGNREGTLWTAAFAQGQDGVKAAYAPSRKGYVLTPGNMLLTQGGMLPDPLALPDAWEAFAPGLYSALGKKAAPRKQKTTITIKNAGPSTAQRIYTLAAKDMNALWPALSKDLASALRPVFRFCPSQFARVRQALVQARFSGTCVIKRFLDRQGGDMGLQFTGKVKTGEGDVRKVTLYGGYTEDQGGYVSLSLPDEAGKKPWKLQLGARMSAGAKRALKLSGTFVRMENGKQAESHFSASLKNTVSEKKERLTGKITLKRSGSGVPFTVTLTPDCTFTSDGVKGSLGIRKETEERVQWQAEINYSGCAVDTRISLDADDFTDLRGGEGETAKAAALQETKALQQALSSLTATLNPGEKAALAVALGLKRENRHPQTEAPVSQDTLIMTLGGDACLGIRENWWKRKDALPAYLSSQGMAWPFSGLRELFSGDDMTLVNLECVLKDSASGEQKSKPCRFRGLPVWTEALKAGSVEQVNLANNHHDDYGSAGMRSTRNALEEAGIPFSGSGYFYIWEINGHRIGFSGVRQRVYRSDPGCIAREIAALRDQGCQVVIFSCHWGEEYASAHTSLQQEMAQAAADAGADLIVGTHPHVPQGMDCLGHTPVLWSLGNLAFGGTLEMKTFDGALARVKLIFDGRGYAGCQVEMIPILTSSRAGEKVNDVHPVAAQGEDRERILRKIRSDSPWDTEGTLWFPAW